MKRDVFNAEKRRNGESVRRVRLGEIVTIKARIGWQGLTRKEHLDTGEYYLITGTDFDDGNVDFERCKYVAKERFDQDSNIQIRNGDILITKDGTIGKVALVQGLNKCATLNSGVFVLRRLIEDVDLRYLYHFFYGPEFRRLVDQSLTGCTIPHLNQAKLVNFMFPLPPLAVQRKIAAELDRICALKRTAEKAVEKLGVLVKARFVEMFGDVKSNSKGWTIGKVSDLARYWNGLTYKPENASDNGIIVLRSSNIQDGKLDLSDLVRVKIALLS